jgi:NitT/TauT family transport system permease protein
MKKINRQLIFYLLVILFWQALVALKVWPEYIFPSPIKVLQALIEGFKNSAFPIAISISLRRIFLGYSISVLLGCFLGIAMWRFRLIKDTIGGLILGLQTLPSICWFPLALIWFGLNEKAIIFVAIMGAIFSITIATESSIRNIPPIYIKVGRNMGARKLVLLWKVVVPAALPNFIPGLKQAWSFAWRSLMAGELLSVNLGLGYLLVVGRELNDMSQVIAVMLVVTCISILIDKLCFGRIEKNISKRWGLKT